MEINKIYEDDEVVLISKPKGLIVHPDGHNDWKTLVDWILENYPELETVGEPLVLNNGEIIWRPGIVHRLDKDTSGLLLIAKSQESFENLKQQFQEKRIQKKYLAIVYGEVKYDEKKIQAELGRSKKDFRKWTTGREIRGKSREAVTEVKVLERGEKFSLLELSPKTGRTHQLRVHMKFDNHPIIGDKLYAGKKFDEKNSENNLNQESQALHAYKISWYNLKGEKKEFQDEIPEIFVENFDYFK